MTQSHSIDDFVAAFGLVQKGKEYVGPCPVCKDGEDRFHVKEGANGPVFGCRHCMDGGNDPNSENAKQVWELLRGGHSLQNDGWKARKRATAQPTGAERTSQAITQAVISANRPVSC